MIAEIHFAYASSSAAVHLGKGQTGCWHVTRKKTEATIRRHHVGGPFASWEEADECLTESGLPVGRYSMKPVEGRKPVY